VIFSQSLVSGTIAVINCVLQILAIIFMFTPSKQVEIDCNQSE
jgi:hypothetical protein